MERIPVVKNYMITRLITLTRDMDVYFAIGLLLKNRISGAPVIDNDNNLVGILSEKDCLRIFANGSFYDMPWRYSSPREINFFVRFDFN